LCSLPASIGATISEPRSLRRLLRDGRQPDWRSTPRHSGRATAGGSRQRAGSKGIERSMASRAAVENHMIGNGSQMEVSSCAFVDSGWCWRSWLVVLLRQRTGCEGNHRQAVQTELAASRDDQSHWLYYEVPSASVTQWVAETSYGNLRRVLRQNGISSLCPHSTASLIALSRIRRRRPGSAKPASMTTSRRRRC